MLNNMALCKQIGTICVSFTIDGTQIAFPVDFIQLDPFDIEWVYKFGLNIPNIGRDVFYLYGEIKKDVPIKISKDNTIKNIADFSNAKIETIGEHKIENIEIYPIHDKIRSKLLKTMRKLKIQQYPLHCYINT